MPVKFAALLLVCCSVLAAQDRVVALDMFAFNQEDGNAHVEDIDGGNPHLNEDFLYVGTRVSARFKVSNVVTLRPTVSLSTIEPGREVDPPPTVTNADSYLTNATTASASATNMTLALITDITPAAS